jgi:spermidine/putrescine transport system substrate-binding protein
MTYHPRENWDPSRRKQIYTRRDFLKRAAKMGVVLPALPTFLAACLEREPAGGTAGNGTTPDGGTTATTAPGSGLAIGTPANPVQQPLFEDNPAIASGLPPEEGPLEVYNWDAYLRPRTLKKAGEELGVDINVTTFFNEEEALSKLASGEVPADVWFPTSQRVPVAVAGSLIQPINHDYLPNLDKNVWPQLADPYYDQGSRYTVPYVMYSTGIAWRTDMVDTVDIDGKANPWDVFWNTKYAGNMGLYDSFTDTIAMALFRNGVADPSAATPEELAAAGDALVELIDLMDVRYTIDGAYAGIPEGRFGLHHAWSGDLVNSQYYWPKGADITVTRYLWPATSQGSTVNGPISNDTMAIPKVAQRPVLAHMFMNFFLDEANSLDNFGWLGYQPPQINLTRDFLIEDGYVPDYLSPALMVPEDFELDSAWVQGPLTPDKERQWNEQWTRAKSGG